MEQKVNIKYLGVVDYMTAYDIQKECVNDVIDGADPFLLFCEHPTVLTKGRMTNAENILSTSAELDKAGVNVVPIDRGGDITLHTPGQLVVYPIVNLNNFKKDLHDYLRRLENVVLKVLKDFNVSGRREQGQTGIWVDQCKVVSLGIGVRKWVTFHGIGINVNTDLSLFQMIRPCGLNVEMNSISNIIGCTINMQEVVDSFIGAFANEFDLIKGDISNGS